MRKGEVGGDSVEAEARAREAQPPTNKERAGRGELAVKFYAPTVGDQEEPVDYQISDLLTDLLHFARREKVDVDQILQRAQNDFYVEVREEGQE